MSVAVGFSKDESPFLNEVRRVIRVKRLSLSTERSYLHYIIDYIYFHDKRHPKTLGEAEVQAYLSHLALENLLQHSPARFQGFLTGINTLAGNLTIKSAVGKKLVVSAAQRERSGLWDVTSVE